MYTQMQVVGNKQLARQKLVGRQQGNGSPTSANVKGQRSTWQQLDNRQTMVGGGKGVVALPVQVSREQRSTCRQLAHGRTPLALH